MPVPGIDAVTLESALYLVSTPIGNLGDITYRAVEALKNVDIILAEDTRHSRTLLNHYDIQTRCEPFHDFNKEKVSARYIDKIKQGGRVALISDAGTPGIADPGFYLARLARQSGLNVVPLPGACAFIAALCGSSLPTDRFHFANFPGKKSARRLRELEEYKNKFGEGAHAPTVGYYVSPHTVKNFITEIGEVFGMETRIVLARELTKKFEEFLDKTVAEHLVYYRERNPKGEFVLMFHPQNKGEGAGT